MEILNISKKDKEVVLALTADELVRLCNVLYVQEKYDDNLHQRLHPTCPSNIYIFALCHHHTTHLYHPTDEDYKDVRYRV